MPRYFFHVRDGQDMPDHDGIELDSPEQARQQAVIAAGETLRDNRRTYLNRGEWRMDVVDETGASVCRLVFRAEHSSD